jgi:hypothetical protein
MLQLEDLVDDNFSPSSRTQMGEPIGVVSQQCSRGYAFVVMNSEEQNKFIVERFKEVDSIELARIVRAIFGHSQRKGRTRKPLPLRVWAAVRDDSRCSIR